MNNSNRAYLSDLLSVASWMTGLGAAFVGFVYLLSFPWDWVVPAAIGLEVVLLVIAIRMEFSARQVSGAAGWATFGFVFGHIWIFAAALVLRGIVLLGQWALA